MIVTRQDMIEEAARLAHGYQPEPSAECLAACKVQVLMKALESAFVQIELLQERVIRLENPNP